MVGRLEKAVGYLILVAASVIALAPIVGVLLLAIRSPDSTGTKLSLLDIGHFGNFVTVWYSANFPSSIQSTAIITTITVAWTVVLSVAVGYALAIMKFRGATLALYLFLLGLMIPFEAMIVPLYFDMRAIGLANTYIGVILPDVALSLAFGAFWMRACFLGSARALIEAARMDGAGPLTTLWSVLLPTVWPMVLTLAVLVFTWTWNDLLLPLVMLSGSDIQTAPMSLAYFQGQHTTNFTYLACAAIITAVPVIIVYVFLQRSFTRGILSGAIKG